MKRSKEVTDAIELVDKACDIYSDGETEVHQCVFLYLRSLGWSEDSAEHGADENYGLWFIEEAVSHGIPRSVAEGKAKLSDHFSKDYINWKCNR